jgi:hypothetical protein
VAAGRPSILHKTWKQYEFILNKDENIFEIMISKIRNHYPEYFKAERGLRMRIEFKGYDTSVQAIVPYTDMPVKFYEWWCKNENAIFLTFNEKIQLFLKINAINPKLLHKKHKLFLQNSSKKQ